MSEAGEIIGRIRLDGTDAFIAELDRAQARADELGSADPKIKVTTEGTGKAVAELEAVKVAEDRVADSTGKVGKAQKDGAKAAADWQSALIGGLVAVSSAAPPVAAAAVGITAALGAMGGAGVLGLAGIARGMKENNAVGQEYRSTVDSLVTSLHSAEDAGAQGLFPGVQKSAALLRQDMPALNGEIGHFAGMLGAMLPTGLDATVTLIERANPLLDAAGGYLGRLVQGLDTWSHGNGYQQFLDYSIRELPQVEKFLGDTGHLVIDFLTAWAPLGSQTLPMLDGLVAGLDDVVKRTGPLVPLTVTLVGAYKGLSPVVGIINNVTGALRNMTVAEGEAAVAGGKIKFGGIAGGAGGAGGAEVGASGAGAAGGAGALLGPLGILAALGFGSLAASNALAPQAATADQYNSASVKQAIAYLMKPQVDRGRGGTNSRGSADGLHDYAAAGGAGGFANGLNGFFGGQTGTDIGNLDTAMASMVKSGNGSKAAQIVKQLGVSAKDAAVDFPGYTAAVKAAGGASAAAAPQVKAAADAWTTAAAAEAAAGKQAQGMAGTYLAEKDAIAGVGTALKGSNGAWSQNTAAGRSNREAVLAAVQAIQAHGAAINADGKHAAEAAVSNDTMAISLEKTMEKFGIGKKAAEAYVNQLLGIPKNRTTEAQLKIDQARINAAKAKQYADDFAHGKFEAILKGDFSPAQKASASAAKYARDFSTTKFEAQLQANHVPASRAAQIAKNAAMDFTRGRYDPNITANPAGAISAAARAKAALASVQSRTIYLNVVESLSGQTNAAQVAMNAARYGAHGGTAGSSSFGAVSPGMAYGGTAGFTVRGPGTAASDQAGTYRLANGEEVMSDLYGQASFWRPALKAMNARMSPAAVLSAVGKIAGQAGHSGPQTVITRHIEPHITIVNPVAVDPVTQSQEAVQYALAYAGI